MLFRDLSRSVRNLVASPGFTLTVIITLGIAIGGNTALVNIIDKVVFQPLPVEKPEELVIVSAPPLPHFGLMVGMAMPGQRGTRNPVTGVSYPLYRIFRDRVHAFRLVAAYRPLRMTMVDSGEGVQASGTLVSGNYFEALGIGASLGRTLLEADDTERGESAVALLSRGFWERQFGSDPAVLGKSFRLNGLSVTIVGVLAAGFAGTRTDSPSDLFLPMSLSGRVGPNLPGMRWDSTALNVLEVFARLQPGINREQARQAADLVYRQAVTDLLGTGKQWTATDRARFAEQRVTLLPGGYVSSRRSKTTMQAEKSLLLTALMCGLILLTAVANVTNLLVSRAAAREREMAIQLALGATRAHILRQRFYECLLLGLLAGVTGWLLSGWMAHLTPLVLGFREAIGGISLAPSYRVMLFTLAIALLTGILLWLMSALRMIRPGIPLPLARPIALSVHGAGTSLNLRRVLVLVQVSLSLVLLCGSVLLARGLWNLIYTDPGFPVEGIVTFSVQPGMSGYSDEAAEKYLLEISETVRKLPGVRSVAYSNHLPLAGGAMSTWLSSPYLKESGKESELADIINASPDYFSTVQLPLVAGRTFTTADSTSPAPVVVINQSLARLLFGEKDPIGRSISMGAEESVQVVGLVKNSRIRSIRDRISPTLYRAGVPVGGQRAAHFLVRVENEGTGATESIGKAVRELDPSVPVADLGLLSDKIAATYTQDRVMAAVSSGFAGLGTVLAGIGLFGLTAFTVERRRREIGVRMALGAGRRSVVVLVLKEVAIYSFVGALCGLLAYVGASHWLASMITGLPAAEFWSMAVATVLLTGVALAAALIPARRALRLQPATILREE